MLTSLDGKIDGAFMSDPACAPALTEYGNIRNFYNCEATLYGTTTMAGGYSDGLAGRLPHSAVSYPKEDYAAATELKTISYLLTRKGFWAGVQTVSTRRTVRKPM